MTVAPIHPAILLTVQALHDAGFTIDVPRSLYPKSPTYPVGHVYVTRQGLPGIALVQVPSFPGFEPVHVDIPVTPSREHGSSVLVDHDGTPDGVVAVLSSALESDTVLTRFVSNPRRVKVDRRVPEDATRFPGE